jgi:hypothetical protein
MEKSLFQKHRQKSVHSRSRGCMLIQMEKPIDTRQTSQVEAEVQKAYSEMFPQGNPDFIPMIFGWAVSWFSGKHSDYQVIDVHYHDLEHTLQGTLCMALLLRRRQAHGQQPQVTQRLFELGILAILMHDTGYLKKRSDIGGTGAKYTLTHVERSIEFAGEFMSGAGFASAEIRSAQNMIRCTGVNVKIDSIEFQDPVERIVGFSLGTADLLGQMAAPDYVDKLPILYLEFAEAAAYNEGKMKAGGFFSSAEDLMQKTPQFWETYVQSKIEREFLGLYRFLADPYPDGHNSYLERIEVNMARLYRRLAGRAAHV